MATLTLYMLLCPLCLQRRIVATLNLHVMEASNEYTKSHSHPLTKKAAWPNG